MIDIYCENPLLKSRLKERFIQAGHNNRLSSYRFLNEIRDAYSSYMRKSNIILVNGLIKGFKAKPLSKSINIPIKLNIQSIINETDDFLLKGIFSNIVRSLSKKLKTWKNKRPKQPARPQVIYDTEKDDLTPKEWKSIDDAIFYYMYDEQNPAATEMITDALRMGMQSGEMITSGHGQDDLGGKTYDEMKEWDETYSTANRLSEAGISDDYAYAAAFAKKRASEGIAIYDENGNKSGKAYELATEMFRNQITRALENEEDMSSLRSRMIFPERWTDADGHLQELSKKLSAAEMKEFTVAHLNRNWERFAFNEIQYAFQNGRLLRWAKLGDEIYVKFGRIKNSKVESCDFCKENNDKILRLFPSEEDFKKSEFYGGGDILEGDKRAEYAVWPGKNNYDRNQANWWICAPVHPYCNHDYILI